MWRGNEENPTSSPEMAGRNTTRNQISSTLFNPVLLHPEMPRLRKFEIAIAPHAT
jgi:hypothetical protein